MIWLLIPIAIVVNGAGGWLITKLNLPLYLDSIGTVFIAVSAGPWVGALTGLITSMILGFVSESYIPYWPVPLLIGLVTGFLANAGWFKRWWKVVLTGFVIAIVAAVASSLIAAQIFGEFTFNPSYFLVKEPVDKIATALIVFIALKILPKQLLALFPRPENSL